MRFALPAEPLRRFVTTYYRTDVVCSVKVGCLEDWLHPEWANVRFLGAVEAQSVIGPGPLAPCPAFTVTGPTSCAVRFRLGSGHSWGIGLLPLGWARLFAAGASDYADRFVDGAADPVFAAFAPLAEAIAQSSGDHAEELALIEAHMAKLLGGPALPGGAAILEVHAALVDPDVLSVSISPPVWG